MLRLLLCAALAAFAVPARAAEKPNILLILADDLGYGDLACYGGTHAKTPNIDRLAREGCRFTDVHSPASTCTPTRRALLTGTYSWRQAPASGILPGDAPLGIIPGTPTMPSLLKQAGYTTGIVGKWHLGLGGPAAPDGSGKGPDWNVEIKPGPLELGFDSAFIMAATGDRVPTVFIEGHRVVGLDPADPITVNYKAKVGDEPTGKQNPELLTLKHTVGHDMTIVNGIGRIGWMSGGKAARWKDEYMADTFASKAIEFLTNAGKTPEKPFFLYFAPHGIHVPRVPNKRFAGVSGHGTRADAIAELDDTVGQVIAALEKSGQLDKTLVIFTSDNGGVMDDGYADFAPGDYRPNGALNGKKGTLLEGGHRIPFLARWPGKIKPARTSDALLAQVDLPASLAALTGVELPKDACLDSQNLLPALFGESPQGRTQFIAHNGGTKWPLMIREGSWKLIQRGEKPDKDSLYNLANDPEEKTDLIAKEPDRAKALAAALTKAREAGRTRE
jgi:arylsulfatase A-like enzyme